MAPRAARIWTVTRLDFGGDDHDEEVVGDAGLFMDWTVNYGDGDLARYDLDDIDEYLLEWCPRKVSTGPEGYLPLVDGAKEWVIHLVRTEQWAGGPVQPVLKRLDAIVPEFLDAMSDPANFGLGKGLFMGPALGGADIDLNDPGSLQAAMDAFNELSFEERKELTDQFMGPDAPGMSVRPSLVDLPPTPAPSPRAVASEAPAVPLLGQVDAVREYLGPRGIRLTTVGNPKLVDAEVLRDLLDTEDEWEQMSGDGTMKPVRSADLLPHLQYLLAVAVVAGAIDDDGSKMSVADGWDDLDPIERCRALFEATLELGASRGSVSRYVAPLFEAVEELLDVGVQHLVVGAFVGGEVTYDEMLDRAVEIIESQIPSVFPKWSGRDLTGIVDRELTRCVASLERCGVVKRLDVVTVEERGFRGLRPTGGRVVMGDLGRYLMEPVLPTIGYQRNELPELSTCSALEAARVLDGTPDAEPSQVWDAWLPEVDPVEKVDQLIDAMEHADDPHLRASLAALISQVPQGPRRRVEVMLDGPFGAYALMSLEDAFGLGDSEDDGSPVLYLSDGRSTAEALGDLAPERALLPVVDMMWMAMLADPDELFALTEGLDASDSDGILGLLDELWRVPVAATADLLEFLGSEHPDKLVAKAARKALFRHRGVNH